jgi:hypothetical protein
MSATIGLVKLNNELANSYDRATLQMGDPAHFATKYGRWRMHSQRYALAN